MTREEAINNLRDLWNEVYNEDSDGYNYAVAIDMAIEALSADAIQGEWVCKEREYNDCDGHYAHYWYECSVCGARPPKDTWKNEWHSDYCPSCGARMYKEGVTE